jgi:hypothetical protein
MKMEQTECSETSAYKIQMPGNYPEENIQQPEGTFPYLQEPATLSYPEPGKSSPHPHILFVSDPTSLFL